jgi:hypothetical protein
MGNQTNTGSAEGGFAAAAGPGQKHHLAGRKGQVDISQDPVWEAGIVIGNLVKLNDHGRYSSEF